MAYRHHLPYHLHDHQYLIPALAQHCIVDEYVIRRTIYLLVVITQWTITLARYCERECYKDDALANGKWGNLTLCHALSLNRSPQKFAGVITSWMRIGGPNFVEIAPRLCAPYVYWAIFRTFLDYFNNPTLQFHCDVWLFVIICHDMLSVCRLSWRECVVKSWKQTRRLKVGSRGFHTKVS